MFVSVKSLAEPTNVVFQRYLTDDKTFNPATLFIMDQPIGEAYEVTTNRNGRDLVQRIGEFDVAQFVRIVEGIPSRKSRAKKETAANV